MKKSKFLKKSLAMLLALMLVVAMIPLSASAVEGDFTVIVNGKAATGTGDVLSATVTSTSGVAITGVAAPDTQMVVLGKDGEPVDDTSSINLAEEAVANDNVYTLTVEFQSTSDEGDSADAAVVKSYTLNITMEEATVSDVNTVKAVVDVDGMSYYTIDNSANTITIYMPFGASVTPSLSESNFSTTDTDANAAYSAGSLTVTAESTSTRVYTVSVKNLTGFETFSVNGQVGDSTITAEGTTNTVTADVAFGTDMTKIVPTFTLGSSITKVTTEINGEEVEVKSGVTAVDFSTGNSATFTLYAGSSDEDGTEVTVTLTEKDNTEAALKTIKVSDGSKFSNEVTVSGTTVDVEVPVGFNFKTDATVTVTTSDKAEVTIPAQNDVEFVGGEATNVDVSGKSFIIRVTSEDGETYTNYTINLTEATSAEAVLNDFTVKDADDVTYTATWSGKTGTLTLPYMAQANLNDYKVIAQASTGATITANSKVVANNVTVLGNDPTNGVDVAGNGKKITVVVSNGKEAKATYTITVKYETAKTGYAITGAETTSEKQVSNMTDDNTYSVTVGSTTTTGNASVKTLKVNVPYSFTNDTTVYFSNLKLSEGAVAYLSDGSNLTEIKALDMVSRAKLPVGHFPPML